MLRYASWLVSFSRNLRVIKSINVYTTSVTEGEVGLVKLV